MKQGGPSPFRKLKVTVALIVLIPLALLTGVFAIMAIVKFLHG